MQCIAIEVMLNYFFNYFFSLQQIASVTHGTWFVSRSSFLFKKRPREVNFSLRDDTKPDKSSLRWNTYFVAGYICTQLLQTVYFLFKIILEVFQKVRVSIKPPKSNIFFHNDFSVAFLFRNKYLFTRISEIFYNNKSYLLFS